MDRNATGCGRTWSGRSSTRGERWGSRAIQVGSDGRRVMTRVRPWTPVLMGTPGLVGTPGLMGKPGLVGTLDPENGTRVLKQREM